MTATPVCASQHLSSGVQISTSLIDALEEAKQLRYKFPDAFIGGSYITNPETANDIDLIIPDWCTPCTVLDENGFDQMHEEYGTSDEIPELHSTWRKGLLNVLVIHNYYVVAYKAAARHMRCNPELYPTRDARIDLHQMFKKQITTMLRP